MGFPVAYTLRSHIGRLRENNYIVEELLDGAEVRGGNDKPYNYFRCHIPQLGHGEFSTAGMTSGKNKRLRTDVDQYESVLLQMDKLFFANKEMFSTPFVRDEIRNVLESIHEKDK